MSWALHKRRPENEVIVNRREIAVCCTAYPLPGTMQHTAENQQLGGCFHVLASICIIHICIVHNARFTHIGT